MWFWWLMTACDIIIPVVMIIGGMLMWKHCPKNINAFFGYRTSLSMKNMDTWKFAHDYCGRLWWRMGLILIVPSVIIHIPFYNRNEGTIGVVSCIVMTVQCITLIASIFPTEAALKRTFNSDGTRK